jgi:LSD1 subclass zinc finger protein
MDKLRQSVANFTALEDLITDGTSQMYHKIVAGMHDLCFHILVAEKNGVPRKEIEAIIKPARDIHSRSVFVKRLQEWPRKYPGDFETLEYICNQENKSLYGTIEYFIEDYALNSTVAQQHRNKIYKQSEIILNSLLNGRENQKLLSVGCGGCRDLLNIENYISNVKCEIVLNDIESDALALSRERLKNFDNVQLVPGNIIQALRKVENLGPFDLVVTGGLFDHLSDKHLSFFLKRASKSLLNGNSTLFFTNSTEGNPFRVWIEYLADWKLFYRSKDHIMELLTDAGFPQNSIKIENDATNLTFLVTVKTS